MVGLHKLSLLLWLNISTYKALFLHQSLFNSATNKLRQSIASDDIISKSLEDFTLEGYVSPKQWALKVGDLKKNLDWFERNFNFTVLNDFHQLPPFPYVL
mmetsp:Transcript_32202/g.44166  ORF Transcript_32202/g.44166 Transcript_32202/m.44166 type:complete len:100 (+) Transcript_32202:3-302(+)